MTTEFEITFDEFIAKFRSMLLQENSNIVLTYKVHSGLSYEFFIPFGGFIYHCFVNEKDLKQFYNSDKFDRDAMFRMFKEELIDKANSVYVK